MDNKMVNDAVFVALRRIIRAIDLRSRFLVNNFGITGPQITVMKELAEHDGLSVCDLKESVHLSQATVTGIIDRLEKKGFVERSKSNKDKRRTEIWLTDKGKQVVETAPALLQEDFTDQFEKLEEWEKSQILSSLQRVVLMMEAKHIDATPILTTGPITATTQETKEFLEKTTNIQITDTEQ